MRPILIGVGIAYSVWRSHLFGVPMSQGIFSEFNLSAIASYRVCDRTPELLRLKSQNI
jgi:hypothetical protein